MKKILSLLSLLLPAVGTMAQNSWVKIGTNMQYGESFTFSAEPCVGDTLLVDFGDGNQVKKGTKTIGAPTQTSRASSSATQCASTGR